jgi:hypothetical protein
MRRVQTEEWPAPIRGWVQAGSLSAPKDAAEQLDNFFPTATTVRLRNGHAEYADLGAAVKRVFNYTGQSEDLLAATATALWDVDRVNGGSNAFAEVEELSSGDWADTHISTSGGEFSVLVNGADYAEYWDGTDFNPISTEAINDLNFDVETGVFTPGLTVTGGTSGATATIFSVTKSAAAAGILKVGTITGTFQDNETITDSSTGSATSDIPSGTSSASSITITGVATTALSQPWIFKERLFFVEGATQSVWYLPVKAIGGAATEINLGSVFKRGGHVLFGATWSVDSGSGLDDMCVFATTNGEIAVYQGTDPASASTWALVGVYDIGKPLNKHAHFKAGGDLAILTDDGIIPVSQAMNQDRAALQAGSLTLYIEDAWQKAIADTTVSFPITATLWQSQTMLLVGVPTTVNGVNVAYVANARTGAWCRYTGWDVRCSTVANDDLYFGSDDGKVYKAETGGDDAGVSYTGICVPKFSAAGPNNKIMNRAQVVSLAATDPTIKLQGLTDYNVPAFTVPTPTGVLNGSTWGVGVWGTFVWGSNADKNSYSSWKKVNGKGFAVSVAALVTSLNTTAPNVELTGFKLRYEVGSVL